MSWTHKNINAASVSISFNRRLALPIICKTSLTTETCNALHAYNSSIIVRSL
jgi:hypothetical protein